MSDGSPPENCFLFQRRVTEREVTVKRVLRVYPTPSPPTRGLGSVVSSPGVVWGGSPAANDFWTFCAILGVYAVCTYCPWKAVNLVYRDSERVGLTQKQSMFVECWCTVETMETGLKLGSHMFCSVCHRHHYSIVEHCKNEKSCPILNFALFDSLACIVARSGEKSRSLSLAPFLARCRSLSLTGLVTMLLKEMCIGH